MPPLTPLTLQFQNSEDLDLDGVVRFLLRLRGHYVTEALAGTFRRPGVVTARQSAGP